ncbi:hypothetical protein [Geobacter sp.]|uniref:hypothetical protein n=1 Tax=Geobacter sp. TaxID=46610 RepID=UPI0027B98DD8|nr:hypothetical protein [Geobacter sp.]
MIPKKTKILFLVSWFIPFPIAFWLMQLRVPNLEIYLFLFALGVWGSAWIYRQEKKGNALSKTG